MYIPNVDTVTVATNINTLYKKLLDDIFKQAKGTAC